MSRAPLAPRAAYRHWTRIDTRWADNDMYGHVNNAAYYGWIDSAVNRWLIGAALIDPPRGPIIGLVVETGCVYARPLSFPGAVEIGLAAGAIGRTSVTYRLGIFAGDAGEAAAEARFTHVYVDAATRRPVPIPESWCEALSRIGG